MRKLVLPMAAVLVLGYAVRSAPAADEAKSEKITGVLVDTHCAEKFKNEKEASAHKASCDIGCAKHGAGFVLFKGDKQYKLDKKGNELAMKYLEKKGAEAKTEVTVVGEKEGDDEIKVSKIMAAPAKG